MQALCAILFLYRDVLVEEVPWLSELERVSRKPRTPLVLTRAEVARLLGAMAGTQQLVARLLYGTGMRLLECLRLRVKDLDFETGEVVTRRSVTQFLLTFARAISVCRFAWLNFYTVSSPARSQRGRSRMRCRFLFQA